MNWVYMEMCVFLYNAPLIMYELGMYGYMCVFDCEQSARWHWWNCVPTIKALFTQPGVMEVFWDSPPHESKHLIKAYQVLTATSHGQTQGKQGSDEIARYTL